MEKPKENKPIPTGFTMYFSERHARLMAECFSLNVQVLRTMATTIAKDDPVFHEQFVDTMELIKIFTDRLHAMGWCKCQECTKPKV